MLWDNEITGLRFNKELQLITSFKNNNTGNNLAYELAENVTVSRVGDNPEKNTKEEIINKIAMPVPGIATKKYLFNNANLVHFNILKVLANKAQLKTNLSFINDYTTNESTVQSTYYFPSAPPVNFREKSNSFINSNKLEGDFFYTVNKQNIYLKNTTKLKLDFTEQKGVVQNNSAISQNLKNPFYQYSNELLAHVLVRKKIISFNSKINFNRLPQQLFVAPGQFADVFNQSIPYGQISQNAVLNNFNTDNSIAFTKKTGKFLNEIKLGTEYIFKNLQTDLNKISGGSSVALNDSFRNNVNWNNGRIYGEIATTLKKGQKQLSILLPVELNALQVKDKIKKSNTRSNYIFFNPAVDIDFPLSPHFAMGVGYNVQHSIGNLSQLTSGYVLTDYRDVSRNDSLLPSERLQNLNLSVYYKDPLNSFFANFSVSVSDTKKNIIFSQVYDNYFITSSAIYFPNSQKSVTLSGSLSKYFIEQKINLKLIGNGTFFNADLLQQNKPIKSISQIYTASLNADFSKWAVATFQSNSAFNVFNNAVKNENKKNTASVSYRLNEVFRLYFSLTKKAQLYFNNEYYSVWDNNNLKKQYFFGDIGFTQRFKKTGMEIEWTNYTNNKWYTAINNFQNLIQINTYKIRSSNVLVKFYFNF